MEVNIKTCHIIYGVSRDFNPEDHNITANKIQFASIIFDVLK